MKALVFHGPGRKAWEEVPDPKILVATDAIVRIESTTICGTDLHLLRGDVPDVTDGRILGHEGVGVITEVGEAVIGLAVGDRVIISCISACGKCGFCLDGLQSHCLATEGASGVGWILGHLIDGTQAEFVRVPFAETSLHRLPAGLAPETGVLLSDILPTGHEIGVQHGGVEAGDVVAVVGVGPVGLAAVMTAQLYGPRKVVAIDIDPNRAELALQFGATHAVVSADSDWREQVMALTDGLGVDVAIEAVGTPRTWEMAVDVVRPGGHVANVGVHGTPVEFPLDRLWTQNLTITTGLVNANTARMLTRLVAEQRMDPSGLVSHLFALDDIERAYDTFSSVAETRALKVVLNA